MRKKDSSNSGNGSRRSQPRPFAGIDREREIVDQRVCASGVVTPRVSSATGSPRARRGRAALYIALTSSRSWATSSHRGSSSRGWKRRVSRTPPRCVRCGSPCEEPGGWIGLRRQADLVGHRRGRTSGRPRWRGCTSGARARCAARLTTRQIALTRVRAAARWHRRCRSARTCDPG